MQRLVADIVREGFGLDALERRAGERDARADFLRAEPLTREIVDERTGARIGEQAVGLRGEHGGIVEATGVGEARELGVGHAGPEKIREARRELVIVDGVNARRERIGFG